MSHKATNWLSQIPADQLSASEFRVLFHLCDCHNPSQGCFPTQEYLVEWCGMARSTVNVALGSLEAKGLIQRHQSIDEQTRRQRPTRYLLGFELPKAQEPCPDSGHGIVELEGAEKSPSRVRSAGPGAVSDLDPEPCPKNGQFRVRPTGHKPVIEPVINQGASAKGDFFDLIAARISDPEKLVLPSELSPSQAREMLRRGLVTEQALTSRDIAF